MLSGIFRQPSGNPSSSLQGKYSSSYTPCLRQAVSTIPCSPSTMPLRCWPAWDTWHTLYMYEAGDPMAHVTFSISTLRKGLIRSTPAGLSQWLLPIHQMWVLIFSEFLCGCSKFANMKCIRMLENKTLYNPKTARTTFLGCCTRAS